MDRSSQRRPADAPASRRRIGDARSACAPVCRRFAPARVACDAGAVMERLDSGLGGPHLDDLAVPLDFDIRSDAGTPPFGILVGLVGQRHQGRTIDGVEELAAAGAELAHCCSAGDTTSICPTPDPALLAPGPSGRMLAPPRYTAPSPIYTSPRPGGNEHMSRHGRRPNRLRRRSHL
jgi:hypothetical protein